jgi:hypothetical protein
MNKSQSSETEGQIDRQRDYLAAGEARDSRTTVRYSLQARVIFSWKDRHGFRQDASGRTRDISQKGAYVVAPECPVAGATVALKIFLPALAGETRTMQLETEGRVMRVEPAADSESEVGFAVSNARINLRAL